jgi:MFS transporter, DHA2 family, multidrug resistance protein
MTALSATPVATAPRSRWAGLAVLAASLLVVVMDMTILNVALPDLTADLRPSAVTQLWIVDAYALVLAGLLVPLSALADRWGRRRMLLTGFTLFGVASLLVLVADSAGAVVAVRVLLGVGGAAIMPATLSLIRVLFPDPRERALALGIWAAMASVGAALGPIVGGALLEVFSWHAAFLVNVPLMVVAVVAGLRLLPESRSDRPGRLDATGVLLSVAGMVSVVYAVKQLGHGPDLTAVAVLALGVALVTAFVRRCLRQDDPMLAVGLFVDRVFRAGVLTALASSTVMMGLLFIASQWLQLVQGWGPLLAGTALLPLAVGGLVGSPLAPSIAARVGVRTVLVAGLVATSAGLATVALLPRPVPYAGLAVAFLVVGLGTAALGVGSALIMGRAPAHQAGSAAALEEMSYEVGGVLGVAVLGSLAGIVYRAGLPATASADATESLAGALGTPVAGEAVLAFTDALVAVGVAGAVLAGLAAVVVWRSLPRDLDLADLHH